MCCCEALAPVSDYTNIYFFLHFGKPFYYFRLITHSKEGLKSECLKLHGNGAPLQERKTDSAKYWVTKIKP